MSLDCGLVCSLLPFAVISLFWFGFGFVLLLCGLRRLVVVFVCDWLTWSFADW